MRVLAATANPVVAPPAGLDENLWRRLGHSARAAVCMAHALGPADALIWTSRVGEREESEDLRHAVLSGRRIRPIGFRASLPTAPAAAVAIAQGHTGPVECFDVCAALALMRARLLLVRHDRVMVIGGDMSHKSLPLPGAGFGGLLVAQGEGLSIQDGGTTLKIPPHPTAGLVQLAEAFVQGTESTLVEEDGPSSWTVQLESR